MEQYVYIFLYVIIEALIIWIWEWRERVRGARNVSKRTRTISWFKRRVEKMQKRRRQRIRKSMKITRQRTILLSYLRYLLKVKLNETTGQEQLANKNELDHEEVTPKECCTISVSNKSQTPDTVVTSLESDVLKISDSVHTDNLPPDVTKDEPVEGEIIGMEKVTDDVEATIDNDLSTVCETSAVEDITNNDSVTDDVKATIDNILSIVYEISDKTAASKTNAKNDYPKDDEKIEKATIDRNLSIVCEIPVVEDITDNDSVTDDVKATIENILSIVCETCDKAAEHKTSVKNDYPKDDEKTKKAATIVCEIPAVEAITNNDSVIVDVKATIDNILSIVCETIDQTAEDKTNAQNDYHKVEDKKVEADETVTVDSKNQPDVIISEPINRPFLFDSEIASFRIVSKSQISVRLIPWNDFDDITIDDDALTSKDGQSWDCEDMFEYNKIHFGYKSSLDKDLSEYTTPLIREDTEVYRLKWERACRLAEDIKSKKLADQATAAQVGKKKKRKKKTNKGNIPTSART